MWLRRFSKITCFATLFLIFVGGMVTSTNSGLSVPDWPLSYGSFFPPMIGGVFYEHGHRMVASAVGFLMLILAIWLGIKEKRRWVRNLGFGALGAVIAQGVLGGLTVLFFLPPAISVAHAFLAQIFFVITIIIAYSQSLERQNRQDEKGECNRIFIELGFALIILIFLQLIVGAIMRHTSSGLAIPDFPTMGGYWFPPFNTMMLSHINHWRFQHNLDPVIMAQVIIHFMHRMGALLIFIMIIVLNIAGLKHLGADKRIVLLPTIFLLDLLFILQVLLGIL